MDNRLHLKPGEVLLQIDNQTYKIPKEVDLIERFGKNASVIKRTSELAREYGVNFQDLEKGISCFDCKHTSLVDKALELGEDECLFHSGPDEGCKYKSTMDFVDVYKGPHTLLFWTRPVFMARKETCAVFEAFYRSLVEQGFLHEFAIGVKPGSFRNIEEFRNGSPLEKQASYEYRASRP